MGNIEQNLLFLIMNFKDCPSHSFLGPSFPLHHNTLLAMQSLLGVQYLHLEMRGYDN